MDKINVSELLTLPTVYTSLSVLKECGFIIGEDVCISSTSRTSEGELENVICVGKISTSSSIEGI